MKAFRDRASVLILLCVLTVILPVSGLTLGGCARECSVCNETLRETWHPLGECLTRLSLAKWDLGDSPAGCVLPLLNPTADFQPTRTCPSEVSCISKLRAANQHYGDIAAQVLKLREKTRELQEINKAVESPEFIASVEELCTQDIREELEHHYRDPKETKTRFANDIYHQEHVFVEENSVLRKRVLEVEEGWAKAKRDAEENAATYSNSVGELRDDIANVESEIRSRSARDAVANDITAIRSLIKDIGQLQDTVPPEYAARAGFAEKSAQDSLQEVEKWRKLRNAIRDARKLRYSITARLSNEKRGLILSMRKLAREVSEVQIAQCGQVGFRTIAE